MAKRDGTVYVDTLIDTDGFGKGVNTMKKQIGGLGNALGKLGAVIAATFAVGKLIDFGKEAINLGSDLQEVQNVVDVTFNTMSDKVDEFAKSAAESAGLSETMAKRYMGTFGAMSKSFGFIEEEAFAMSKSLTQMVGDVASFYNLTQDEAYTKLKAVYTGETESLKDLGVVMTQTALDSYAMANGFGMTTKSMTEQQKVALRYQFVLEQLNGASGDFVRSSDSWANRVRFLTLQFDSFKATIGQGFINILTPVIKMLNVLLAKLQQVANAFKSLTEQLFGKQETKGATENLENIEDGYEGITDATEDAEKAQKSYLSGLDEIKTFQSSESEGAGDISLGGSPDTTSENNQELERTGGIMDALIQRAKELVGLFKEGFVDGLGDTTSRIESMRDSFASIKESFKDIFSPDALVSMNESIDTITKSIGTIAGAGASIGLTLGTNLMGGLALYLESDKDEIQQYLVDMFDIGAKVSAKFADLSGSLAYIFESFANNDGQQITADIIGVFSDAFMEISQLVSQLGLDLTTLIVDPFVNSEIQIKQSFEDMLAGISDFTGEVRRIYEESFDFLSKIYEEYISPIFQKLMPEMEKFYKEHMAPLLSKVGEFFSSLGENLGAFWDGWLKPMIEWIQKYIMPVIAPILEALGKSTIQLFGLIEDLIGNLLDILGGLITFIVGVFTRDWRKAWDGIVQVFRGIFNTFVSVVESGINNAINAINAIINGVNNVSSNIGVPAIPTIPSVDLPYLATGAVIPPNAPFMAILGDQKHGTNIEAPLDTIKQAVREVVGNGTGGQYQFTAQINRRTLFDEMIDEAKLRQSTSGRNPFDLARGGV